jgi:hypothetical protein
LACTSAVDDDKIGGKIGVGEVLSVVLVAAGNDVDECKID